MMMIENTDTVDRVSELPDFILHSILCILDTKEACRACVLSKRWYGAWSSIPVLDFHPQYFKDGHGYYSYYPDFYDDIVDHFVGFIDKTMRRYFMQKYRITKLRLVLPMVRKNREQPFVDRWIWIAVQNQIWELDINILYEVKTDYKLPEILFHAKSLEVLKCEGVELPYYESMELISLKYLKILFGAVDEDMLQRIVSFCSLIDFEIHNTKGLIKNSLPSMRLVNKGAGSFSGMQSNLKASLLTKLVYVDSGFSLSWLWNMNVGLLKNLRKLDITCGSITDDLVSELANGLLMLESLSLTLTEASKLKRIMISSMSLKELRIVGGPDLITATVDAPNLLEFWYHGETKVYLSLIRVQDHCNTHFFPPVESIFPVWFIKLKKFLMETNLFKSLVIDLSDYETIEEVGLLDNVVTSSPYKLRELKLLRSSDWCFVDSSLTAFLDGMFWSCHPEVISITEKFDNWTAKLILDILKSYVRSWKHPLENMEVVGVDNSRLLSESSEVESRFRLSWPSV